MNLPYEIPEPVSEDELDGFEWEYYETHDAAAEAAGFNFYAPISMEEYGFGELDGYYVSEGVIDTVYLFDEDGEMTIRKGKTTADVTGGYEAYVKLKEVNRSGVNITLFGDDVSDIDEVRTLADSQRLAAAEAGGVSLATWVEDGHFYCIFVDPMIYDEDMLIIAATVIAGNRVLGNDAIEPVAPPNPANEPPTPQAETNE